MQDARPSARQRIEYAGVAGVARALPSFPAGLIRPLAGLLGSAVWALDRAGRRVSMANLEAAFPEKYSAGEKRKIARASYAGFARTMLELFSARGARPNFLEENFEVDVAEDTVGQDPGRAAIYVCFHYSNFEWLGLVEAPLVMKGPVIAQKFRNPLIGPVFDRLRTVTGHHVIPQERAMIRMLAWLREKKKFGMLGDLNLDPSKGGTIVRAFGGLYLNATNMHVALAQRTGAAVVPVAIMPAGPRKYLVRHFAPIECPADAELGPLVQRCWDTLEGVVREAPQHWLWSYKHWRFRPSEEGADRYPFYANRAKRFDKALKLWKRGRGGADGGAAGKGQRGAEG